MWVVAHMLASWAHTVFATMSSREQIYTWEQSSVWQDFSGPLITNVYVASQDKYKMLLFTDFFLYGAFFFFMDPILEKLDVIVELL